MNFDNIFEYQIDIYDSVSYITVHELYDTPTNLSLSEMAVLPY